MKPIQTIDQVIDALAQILEESKHNNDPLGYFAALYQKVTIKVKEGIQNGFFEDGDRMEKLDVIFAKRYIEAFYAHKEGKPVTASWQKAFEHSNYFWAIVLQHLLVGMNAHINLDLGIAAAQVAENENIENLKGDFDKINEILSSLVAEVEHDLSAIWPTLRKILKLTHKVDNFLIDFSMELARDGAWKFATSLWQTPPENIDQAIILRDQKVAEKTKIITNPGWIVQLILAIARLGEQGTVTKKIIELQD